MPKPRWTQFWAAALVVVALFSGATSLAAQTVRVGVYSLAPLLFMENGEGKGFSIDILRDTAEREGWQLVFVPGTWDQCMEWLDSGKIDLLPNITKTSERERTLRFTEEHLFLDWGQIYRKKGSGIRTIFDLQGKTIAVLRSSAFTQELGKLLDQYGVKAHIVPRPDYAGVLEMVARGEVDAGVCTNAMGSRQGRAAGVEPTDIVFAPTKIRYGVKKGGHEALLLALDRRLAELKAQPGSLYYVLYEKWLGLAEPRLPAWAHWATAIVVVVFCLMAGFVLILRLMVQRKTRELERTYADLTASEARYRDIVETANEGVWTVDSELRTTFVNRVMAGMLGYETEEMLGRKVTEFMFPADLADHEERAAQRRRGQDGEYERRYRTRGGGEIWALMSVKALMDGQGRFTGSTAMLMDISARRKAEAALRESEQHFRILANSGQALIWTSGPDMLCDYFNEPWLAFTGRRLEQELGNGWTEGVHPEDYQRCLDIYVEAFERREPFSMEYRLRHASGGYRWIVDKGTPRHDSDGRFLGYIGHCLDISELKRAEEARRKGEATLSSIIENTRDWVWSVDAENFGMLLFNHAVREYFRHTHGLELQPGMKPEDILPPERAALWRGFYQRALDEGSFQTELKTLVGPTELLLSFDRVPREGRPVSIVLVAKDVTELKEAEKGLRESQALSQAVINASFDCIKVLDDEGRLQFMSKGGQHLLEIEDLEPFLGGYYQDFWPPEVHGLVRAAMEEARLAGVGRFSGFCPTLAGTPKWWDVIITLLGSEGALPLRYLVVSRDISESKQAEKALVAAKEAAEAANRAKSEFLANMSHELRTPMNGALGMLQLLMMEEMSANQQLYVRKAFEASNRLMSLLNDVLDFTRIEAGVLTLRHEPFNPGDILAATTDIFSLISSRKGLTLSIEADESLPDLLLGDEGRIRQLVFNLVGNAVKFTRRGGIRVQAWHLGRNSGQGRLYLSVADTGVGIPEDKLDSVFDRFSQADSSYTRQFEGAGLGLAIVRRIVGVMGGTLCIESEPGQGTTMVLMLPGPVSGKSVQSSADERVLQQGHERLRILLAEDELIGQMSARLMLERMGHSVDVVGDGRSAVEAVLGGDYDCVLMDIQMPEMDGLEAARIIRSSARPGRTPPPIVAMTAYALSGDREKFLAAGMDEYLAKPFQQAQLGMLMQTIARRLRQSVMQ